MGKWVHRITNVRPEVKLADCAGCGPDSPVVYRPHRNQWACRVGQSVRSPEAKRRRRSNLHYGRRRYGLTPADYAELLDQQGGTCAICSGVNESGRRLAVDHCHESGRVRGLLCSRCNTALGLMKDDPERLLRAIHYLALQTA